MAPTSVYLEYVSDEDQFSALAKAVSDRLEKEAGEAYTAEAQALIEAHKYTPIIERFFNDTNAIVAALPEKEVSALFLLAFIILKKIPAEEAAAVHAKFVSAVTSSSEEKAQTKLKLLQEAHNATSNAAFRLSLVEAILQYATSSHSEALVNLSAADVERAVRSGKGEGATAEQRQQVRNIHRLYADVLGSKKLHRQRHDATLQYLSLLDSEELLASSTDAAVRAVVDAVNVEALYSFDALLDVKAVQRLEQSSPSTWQLLQLFANGTLADYHALSEEARASFESAGVDNEHAIRKLRALTLASLGTAQSQLPYATAAQALGIEEDQLEAYVVVAISEGIVDARLDQLKRVVNITRTIERQFKQSQWQALSDTLTTWRTNLKSLLHSLDSVKEQHPFTGPA